MTEAASEVYCQEGQEGRPRRRRARMAAAAPEGTQAPVNVYDLIAQLQQAPALKAILLNRMDEEYQNYRRATEKALDAVAEVVRLGLEPVYRELARLERKVDEALGQVRPAANAGPRPAGPRRRIRWGSSPEDIRATVFRQLEEMLQDGEELSTELIKRRIPSMLRWIYGERAVFNGIEGLREEFRRLRAAGRQPGEVQPA